MNSKYIERECSECGKMFMPKSGSHKYCSLYCQRKNNRIVKQYSERQHRCWFCEVSIFDEEIIQHEGHAFHKACLEEYLNPTGTITPIKRKYKKCKRLGGIEVEDSWFGKIFMGEKDYYK